jgi:hypothetical protein
MPQRPAEPLRDPAFTGSRTCRSVTSLEVGFAYPKAAVAWSFAR